MQTLWRLENISVQMDIDAPLVADVLRVHLAHAPLTAVLMQIGAAQRLYLALDGCPGCADSRCLPGCRADLLRRALRASGVGELALVREGLAARPYAQAVLALPSRDAQPLDGALLSAWSDARLILHWRTWTGDMLAATALLLTGEGPDPLAVVRACRWQAFALRGPLRRRSCSPSRQRYRWGDAGMERLTCRSHYLAWTSSLSASWKSIRQPKLTACWQPGYVRQSTSQRKHKLSLRQPSRSQALLQP